VPAPAGDSPSDLAPPAASAGRLVRPVSLWFLALVLVPVLLTALLLVFRTGSMEDDLQRRSLAALSAEGITGATVEFSGRDATISAATDADLSELRDIVAGVDGVRTAEIGSPPQAVPGASTTPTAPGRSPTGQGGSGSQIAPFSIGRSSDTVELTAAVPDETTKNAVLVAAQVLLPEGGTLVDEVTIDERAGKPNLTAIDTLLRTLAKAAGDVSVGYDGRVLSLTGELAQQDTKATAGRAAAATVPGAVIANRLHVPNAKPPRVVSVCDAPQMWLDRIVAQGPILFVTGTAVATKSSGPSIARVASLLKNCPTVRIRVDGHTDNLGDASHSLPLSLQRAVLIKAALVRFGIVADRITVKGFGETRPIASNDTPAGQLVNRRVEFKVR